MFLQSAAKKYLVPYLADFVFAMIKVLSVSPQESSTLVDFALKSEIIKVRSNDSSKLLLLLLLLLFVVGV